MEVRHLKGNTFYFSWKGLSIPFYRLSEKELILIDTGFDWTGQKISEYCRENHLRITAIIHTHLHPDHIGGDKSILEEGPIPVYSPSSELTEYLKKQREDLKKNVDAGRYKAAEIINSLDHLSRCFTDTDGLDSLEISGKCFSLIPCPGHSLSHQLIVTPDQVCCLGDALLAGDSLTGTKLPYSYDLVRDIQSKKDLCSLNYPVYTACHEGAFLRDQLQEVIAGNLTMMQKIFDTVRAAAEKAVPEKLQEAVPDRQGTVSDRQGTVSDRQEAVSGSQNAVSEISYDSRFASRPDFSQVMDSAMDALGIGRGREAVWVQTTVKQYYEIDNI